MGSCPECGDVYPQDDNTCPYCGHECESDSEPGEGEIPEGFMLVTHPDEDDPREL